MSGQQPVGKRPAGKSTLSIWGGEQEHPLYERSTQVPVVYSVSYTYDDLDTWQKVARGEEPGHIYSRNTNPTIKIVDIKRLAAGVEFDGTVVFIDWCPRQESNLRPTA